MPRNLSIAVVCSSNMNRSTEAHAFLRRKGFNVQSYGTGDKVRLPGPSPDLPNVYEFGVSYEDIYNDLVIKDKRFYHEIGLLNMLDRNRRLKKCPEQFQKCEQQFDVIFTCEERIYDQVLEWFHSKEEEAKDKIPQDETLLDETSDEEDSQIDISDEEDSQNDEDSKEAVSKNSPKNRAVHIVNIDIQDNHEDATIGAFIICDLATEMSQCTDLDDEINDMIQVFDAERKKNIMNCVMNYY